MKKVLPVIAVALIAAFALSCCAAFNAPKEPVKAQLDAWKKGDWEEAYSCFSDDAQEVYSFSAFKSYAEANPIKTFKITSISISADGPATVKGSVTMKSGEKLGFRHKVVEAFEGEWKIWSLEAFSRDILMED